MGRLYIGQESTDLTAPASPLIGMYPKTDGFVYYVDSNGTIRKLAVVGSSGVPTVVTGVAGTNTITGTVDASISSYSGLTVILIPANANTGAVTLNLTPSGGAALGAKNVYGNGIVLTGGEMKAGVPYLAYYDGTQFQISAATGAAAAIQRMGISGLTYSVGTDAVNDTDIAAGSCRDLANAQDMVLSSTLTKQSDANWAVGTNAGGLDTGAVGNSDYYIWLIKRSDTGVVDALYSLSSTAPTMPASYDAKRLIGWVKRTGGTIVAYHTYETEGGGIEMNWDVPTLDINLANTLTTARRTDAVKVPLNFSTIARLRIGIADAGTPYVIVCCPDETDAAPSQTVAPLYSFTTDTVTQTSDSGDKLVRTGSTGLIAARATIATIDTYRVVTVGFTWARRN